MDDEIQRLLNAAGNLNNLNEVKSLIENDGVDINSKDNKVNKSFSFFLSLFYFILEWMDSFTCCLCLCKITNC